MSTVYLSIQDLLRVAWTYEARAAVERSRVGEKCLVCLLFIVKDIVGEDADCFKDPDTCSKLPQSKTAPDDIAGLETDFTKLYAGKKEG
jgi:hypothetical protein